MGRSSWPSPLGRQLGTEPSAAGCSGQVQRKGVAAGTAGARTSGSYGRSMRPVVGHEEGLRRQE